MKNNSSNSLKDYWWHKVDREMWDTSHLSNLTELSESIKRHDGFIALEEHETVLAKGYFSKGIPYGAWNFWYSNKQIAKQYTLPKERHPEPYPQGLIKEWYMNGNIALEGSYGERRGEMAGVWKGWNESEEISLEEGKRYDSGILGAVFFKDKDIDVTVFMGGDGCGNGPIECTKDGYRRYMILLPQGKKAHIEGCYRNGLRQEWWKLWMYDGRIISLTYYKDGLPDGFCFIVDPWLLSNCNDRFKEFTGKIKYLPYLVYFMKGKITTKEAYEKNI